MANAYAMGRPLASRPLHRQDTPGLGSRCIQHRPYSKRMTTNTTHRDQEANIRHYGRWANTVSFPSTLAVAVLPSNPQTSRRLSPSLQPSIFPQTLFFPNKTFSTHFFFFQPFHHGPLLVNIGLSLPSKAAHQLP